MVLISRTDTSLLGQWWWSIDRWMLLYLTILLFVGVMVSMTASPIVASNLGMEDFYFVKRHVMYLPCCVALMIGLSFLSPRMIRLVAFSIFAIGVIGLIVTPFIGAPVKGARRWLYIYGQSLQVSEFVKPTFIIISAWLFYRHRYFAMSKGLLISIILLLLLVLLLSLQPDFGMIVMVVGVWLTQFFLTGLSLKWFFFSGTLGILGLSLSYFIFPHVARRVDRFFDPSSGDVYGDYYQVSQAMDAFMSGGFFGVGPGEGIIKRKIPDVHADFVFAVIGEEFGLIACLLLISLFAAIVVRSLKRAMKQTHLFILLSVSGLTIQFGLQVVINLASTMNLIPTKGMTLPFISYGGSSMLAISFAMGMLLGLSRAYQNE